MQENRQNIKEFMSHCGTFCNSNYNGCRSTDQKEIAGKINLAGYWLAGLLAGLLAGVGGGGLLKFYRAPPSVLFLEFFFCGTDNFYPF